MPHVPDGLTIRPLSQRRTAGRIGTKDHIPDNGQVERMNRTIKDATVRRFYYESHDQLHQHLADFVAAITSLAD
ncbi:hypothetical protein AJ88_37910 [Mesorhizobium amorphae CCBAU 01583]|nr:hypothetical protein AJ88_37910 [Mesorhizobium amorphae CCBAU 01583]